MRREDPPISNFSFNLMGTWWSGIEIMRTTSIPHLFALMGKPIKSIGVLAGNSISTPFLVMCLGLPKPSCQSEPVMPPVQRKSPAFGNVVHCINCLIYTKHGRDALMEFRPVGPGRPNYTQNRRIPKLKLTLPPSRKWSQGLWFALPQHGITTVNWRRKGDQSPSVCRTVSTGI